VRAGAPASKYERLAVLDSIELLLAGEGLEPLLRNAPQGIEMRELVRLCGRAPEHIALPAQARIIEAAGERFVFLDSQWLALGERAVGALRTFHAEQPDEPGIDRGRLRRMTLPTLADARARRDRRSRAAAGRAAKRDTGFTCRTSHHLG